MRLHQHSSALLLRTHMRKPPSLILVGRKFNLKKFQALAHRPLAERAAETCKRAQSDPLPRVKVRSMRYRPFNRAFSSRLLRGNRDILGTSTTQGGLDSRRFQDMRVTRKEKGKRLGWDDTSFGAHPSKPTAQPPYSNIHAVIDYAPDTLMVWGSNPSHDLDLQGLPSWPPATWRALSGAHTITAMEHARSGDRSAARSSLARGLALLQAGQLGVPSADPSAEETNGCRAPGSSYLALGQSVVVGNKQSGGFPVHGGVSSRWDSLATHLPAFRYCFTSLEG